MFLLEIHLNVNELLDQHFQLKPDSQGYASRASDFRQAPNDQVTLGDIYSWIGHWQPPNVARSVNEALYNAGYDSIYHVGGAMQGGANHNVMILLSKPRN